MFTTPPLFDKFNVGSWITVAIVVFVIAILMVAAVSMVVVLVCAVAVLALCAVSFRLIDGLIDLSLVMLV